MPQALAGRWRRFAAGSINRRILGAAITVGTLTFGVNLATAAKDVVVATSFGIGNALDAFLIAYLLPTFIISVVAASFNAALVPILIEIRENEGQAAAQRLFSGVTFFSLGLLISIAVLLALASPALLPFLASGFGPQKLALTQSLFYLLLPIIAFGGLATIWGAVLNAGERFALAAIAGIMVPVLSIAGLLLLGRGWGIYSLAFGMVTGFVLQSCLLAWGLKRQGLEIKPGWHGFHPPMKRVVGQYFPMVAGSALISSTLLVDQAFAAGLGSGSVAALGYGTKIVALILSLGATAIRTAVLPYFSRMVGREDWPAVRHTLRTYTGLILLGSIPVTILLVLFATPLVEVIFEHGAFTARDTSLVARTQQMFALQIPFYIMGSLITPLISSLRQNRILMIGAAISLPLDVLLDFAFSRLFGVVGIALATAIVYTVSWLFLTLSSYRIIRRHERALIS